MELSQTDKGKIVIMKERGYSFQEISLATGVPLKQVKKYWKNYQKKGF